MKIYLHFFILLTLSFAHSNVFSSNKISKQTADQGKYLDYARECIDNLMLHGTDRYGVNHAPILVSILDLENMSCPEDPLPYDEYFRVTRRGRRNPAGSNLLSDQVLLKTMRILSEYLASPTYAEFAAEYEAYYLENLTDKKDFIWWGWHRHYDVHKDVKDGHDGNHHEIHALHDINWEYLWGSNALACEKEINAIWKWHVIDKQTGEINRHGDGRKGCDFSISGGAIIEAFIFMYTKSKEPSWLKKAELIADYYWEVRNTETNLFPERPNAGSERFDGSSFVTSITGLYCHSLLQAYEKTGIEKFRTQAITYLSAYNKYGYDKNSGKYWGALNLNGTHIPGPRIFTDNIDSSEGYLANQPRGHLDLWEPYILGYQYPIYTAQVYAYAYELTGEPEMLEAANRFAVWISNTPIGTVETKTAWYSSYTNNEGLQGTYAGKYGRTVSFYLQMFILTGDYKNLSQAKKIADLAINKLYYKGMFRGHPAKQYYEAVDGVGYLLYALVQLNEISKNPEKSLQNKGILFGDKQKRMQMDNW